MPSKATRSYSASLAEMTKSGYLDMVLSNDLPDAKLVLVNDGKGNFTVGGTYGEPDWATRNAAVGDLNEDPAIPTLWLLIVECRATFA